MEGFASTVRGAIRFVRESCYAVLYCMSRMDTQFYGFEELPGPLAHALLADSFNLSAHQLINLLNLVRHLVDNCPVQLREHFLPPILAACCQQIDVKINSEWDKIDQQQATKTGGEALTEEMKAESILRQLTYTAVMMIADFLDPARANRSSDPAVGDEVAQSYPTLRKFCLMQSSIVEPLLVFCTHVIRMRDTRCCSVMVRVFRSIVPEFTVTETSGADGDGNGGNASGKGGASNRNPIPAATASVVREYISSDVIKACITSIHEPYFVELQKDLASLVAAAVASYAPLTPTPREVLCSLPGVDPSEVDDKVAFILRGDASPRQQRASILDLLRDLKGVSISEMGRLSKSVGLLPTGGEKGVNGGGSGGGGGSGNKKTTRSKMAQQFMTAPASGPSGGGAGGGGGGGGGDEGNTDAGLDGLANLFQ